MALERLDQHQNAEIAFLRAFELDPESNPMPMVLDELQLEKAILNALTELPLHIQDFYNPIERIVEMFPSKELMEQVKPTLSPLINLYLDAENDRLHLYIGNLKYLYHKNGPLQTRLKVALIEEAELFHSSALPTE